MLPGDVFQRLEFIDARIVYQDIQPAKGLFGFGEEMLNVRRPGNVWACVLPKRIGQRMS